jgi:hypothetical protein
MGCASTGAPDYWLSQAREAPRDPYGGWVTVRFVKDAEIERFNTAGERRLGGEFLAVDADSLYVLTGLDSVNCRMVGIPLTIVDRAKVAQFDPETTSASAWIFAGGLSTLSHGWALVFSLPVWLLGGTLMVQSHVEAAMENYPVVSWNHLAKYARFPQGPPPGIHEMDLRPKPLHYQIR